MRASRKPGNKMEPAETHSPIRVFVVDDHEVAREGLGVMLREEADIEIIGSSSRGEEAMEVIDKIVPDVVLMDVRLPDSDGFAAARRIRAANPGTAIIMLTGYDSDLYASESRRLAV